MKRGLLVILIVLCAVFLTGQGCQIYAGENLDLAAQCIQYDYTACSDDGFVIECEAPVLDSNSLWDVTVTSEVCDSSTYVSVPVPVLSVPVTGPDIVIDAVTYSITNDGQSLNIHVDVRNDGTDDITTPFTVVLDLEDSTGALQTDTGIIPSLSVGETYTYSTGSFDFSPAVAAFNVGSPEEYEFSALFDSENVVAETNEPDNELTGAFTADLSYFETFSDVPPVDLSVAVDYLGPFPNKPGTFVLADEGYTNYEMDITVDNAGFLNYVPPFTGPHFNLRYNSIIFFQSETPSVLAGGSTVLSFADDNGYDETISPHSVFLTMSWLDVLDDTVNTNYDPLIVDFFYKFDNTATWLSGTFDLPYPDCVDYDGGNDWSTAPIVSYVVDNGVQVPDVCNPTNPTTALNEQYCSGNSAAYAYYNCMSSPYTGCSAGACV
jgi:hypothetical protein